uniref:Histone-lysine N-methyltransferase n=1 Tax=Macrostomum lignano TaxID=282301 RepID=A0A1I8HR48_9PLAT
MHAWKTLPAMPPGWESRIDAIRRLSVSVLVSCLAEILRANHSVTGRMGTRRLWDMHMAALEEYVPRQMLARTALEYLRLTEPLVYRAVLPEFEINGKVVEVLVHKFLFQIVNIETAFHNALGSDANWSEVVNKIGSLEKTKQKLEETVRHQEKVLDRLEKRSRDQQIAWYGRVVYPASALACSSQDTDADEPNESDNRNDAQTAAAADGSSAMARKSLIMEAATAPHQSQQQQAASVLVLPSGAGQPGSQQAAANVGKYRLVHPEELVSVAVVAQQNQPVFALFDRELWRQAVIADVLEPAAGTGGTVLYRVSFAKTTKQLKPSQVALSETAETRLEQYPVGARVVSSYTDDRGLVFYYSAIVAEPPGERNSRRYLLFFDDGYAQYAPPSDVRRVLQQTPQNWREVAENSQDFVRAYLDRFPNRTMLRLRPGLTIRVELRGEWLTAVVERVDASLVQVRFPTRSGRLEWLYRGSTRLEDLYKAMVARERAAELAAAAAAESASEQNQNQQQQQPTPIRQAFARKSSMGGIRRQHKHQHQQHQKQSATLTNADPDAAAAAAAAAEEDACYEEARAGVMVASIDSESLRQLRPFPHQHGVDCGVNCLNSGGGSVGGDSSEQNRLASTELVDRNPLDVPLLLGWHRFVVKLGGPGRVRRRELIEYAAPCGRRIRNPVELDRILSQTSSRLHPLHFCFDPLIRVATEFQATGARRQLADLSYGKERIPVPAVNCLDADEPPFIDYTPQRMPLLNVCTNEADKGFLVCCDCTDGCRDRTKCACLRLTAEASATVTGRTDSRPAYENGRLVRALIGGVYECNSGCSCRQWQCRNRLVQRGLHSRLQIFKTSRKGWGLRPLHDLPKGAFVCVYAGELYSEELAVQYCDQFGDEYQADLDHLEVMEQEKFGYEAQAIEPHQQQLKQKSWLRKSQSQSSLTNDNGDNEDPDEEPTAEAEEPGAETTEEEEIDNDDANDEDYCGDSRRKRRLLNKKSANTTANAATNSSTAGASANPKRSRLDDEAIGAAESGSGSTVPKAGSGCCSQQNAQDHCSMHDDEDAGAIAATAAAAGSPCSQPLSSIANADQMDEAEDDDVLEAGGPAACLRALLGEAQPYIMDAKRIGNLGRYLNHSCAPNVIVQNVFVNTHDPRFPEIAFFTCKRVRAGEELCWDYNYQVGSVPGKTLRCFCRARDCRGRLL